MFSMAKIMVEERGETLRESPLFSTTNKEKKGSIPNCNNISIVNIKLIRFILLLQKHTNVTDFPL